MKLEFALLASLADSGSIRCAWLALAGAALVPLVGAQERSLFQRDTNEHLAHLSTPGTEAKPDISADGLSLLYASDGAGGVGDLDLWVATRPSLGALRHALQRHGTEQHRPRPHAHHLSRRSDDHLLEQSHRR